MGNDQSNNNNNQNNIQKTQMNNHKLTIRLEKELFKENPNVEKCKQLMINKANPNSGTINTNTPLLSVAMRRSNVKLIKLMLEFKANPNNRRNTFNEVLSGDNRDIIILMLTHGGIFPYKESLESQKISKTAIEIYESLKKGDLWKPIKELHILFPDNFKQKVFLMICCLKCYNESKKIKLPNPILYLIINFTFSSFHNSNPKNHLQKKNLL